MFSYYLFFTEKCFLLSICIENKCTDNFLLSYVVENFPHLREQVQLAATKLQYSMI